MNFEKIYKWYVSRDISYLTIDMFPELVIGSKSKLPLLVEGTYLFGEVNDNRKLSRCSNGNKHSTTNSKTISIVRNRSMIISLVTILYDSLNSTNAKKEKSNNWLQV